MKRILLLTLPLLAACGPRYGMRVPDDMVKKLPYETRIELLEAENDLALAIDKLDQASSEILRARTRRTARPAGASEPPEKRDGAVDPEKLRGEMGQTQNRCAHECGDFRKTARSQDNNR